MKRRDFLKIGLGVFASYLFPIDSLFACIGGKKRYGMLIDISKCDGCCNCVTSCVIENNLGIFGNRRIDNYWIRIAKVEGKNVPLLCNHCEDPPCVRVCPVGASFIRDDDGIVLIDPHRCIGCRYCMIACPYKARSFVFKDNPITNKELPKRMVGVVGMCTFCVHRIDKGLLPVCVDVCPKKVFTFGDIKSFSLKDTHVIREDLRLKPKVYYLGL